MKQLAILLTLFILVGCKKKEEAEPENKATTCSENYHYGSNCQAYNEFYAGSGTLNEDCTVSGVNGYSTMVASASDPLSFTLSGLWDEPSQILTTCRIKSDDRFGFTATKQALGSTGFDIEIINGSISSDGNTITYTYKIYSGNVLVEECEGTIAK
jgi:hypothetical protein